jgi:hypothetical protein
MMVVAGVDTGDAAADVDTAADRLKDAHNSNPVRSNDSNNRNPNSNSRPFLPPRR